MAKKVLMSRVMPYTTLVNRARQFRALGWEPYLLYEQPPANSALFMQIGRVFEEAWSLQTLLHDTASAHDFIRRKGFDLLYTVGPPDRQNVHFMNAPCAWIHDLRDMTALCDPKADDPNRLKELRENFRDMTLDSSSCVLGADLTVYVSPWQKSRGDKIHWDGRSPKPSVWLPNIPYYDVYGKIVRRIGRDRNKVYWGYTGTVGAAWHNAGTFFGNVATELEKLGVAHEFHMWSFMEMQEAQDTEWMFGHDTLEQHKMIVQLGEWLDYGIIPPPTKSDGMNGPTGWPGKLGDYIMAGVPVFVPENFMARKMLRENGWGFAYSDARDVARIMASKRGPQQYRKAAPYLGHEHFLKKLDAAIRYSLAAFKEREVKPVTVAVEKPLRDTIVCSDGNQYHAKNHIAKVLGTPFAPLLSSDREHPQYLYVLGMWAMTNDALSCYDDAFKEAERVVLQWAGSDIMALPNHPAKEWAFEVLRNAKIVHTAPHAKLADEVTSTLGVPCHIVNTPSMNVYEKVFSMPRRFAVSVYYPPNRDLYQLDLVDEVIERMPDVTFYLHYGLAMEEPKDLPKNAIWLGAIGKDVYPEFLRTVSCFLRLTKHDGMPYSVIEHACAGRRVVTTQDFPMCKHVKPDAIEVLKAINECMREKDADHAAAAYWRAWNDHERFRKRIRGFFKRPDLLGGTTDAESVREKVEAAVQEEGVVR